jgi:hypothetical protein
MFLFHSASEYLSLSPAEFSIDKSIFIKPKTFHLTVLMLKLWNKDRIAKASDVLQVLPFRKIQCYWLAISRNLIHCLANAVTIFPGK